MDRLGHSIARAVERALAEFTRAPTSLDYRRAGLARRGDLASLFGSDEEPVIAIQAPLTGSIGGCVLLVCQEAVARAAAGRLASEGNGPVEGLDDKAGSALREATHVTGNAALSAMNRALGLSMITSSPRMMCLTRGNLWRLVDESLWPDDKLLFTLSLLLRIGEGGDATLTVCTGVPSIDHMLESLSEFYRDGRPVLPGAADLGPGEGLVVAEALGSRGAPADSISPVAAGASPRVLVVDDSAYFRAKTVRWLRSLGMGDVMETADGEEALRLYSQRRPDLVLLDLVMDGKSGVEVLREIKAIDPKARIVVVSAVGQDLLMEECRRQGALGFLVKPVAPERLAAEIKEAVSR